MTEKVLKFGGIDALSRTESERGDEEPDNDPRLSQGVEVVRGLHMMNAVQQLEPAAGTRMAYFDPDSEYGSLEELQRAVESGEATLEGELTTTDRFSPLVNPRRSRRKRSGELPADSDADLWHVPTSNYTAMPPTEVFQPAASVIDNHDGIPNDSVFGEFRTRRNGGEVFGEVLFDTMRVDNTEGDPVRLGVECGWDYFGGRAFFLQPFAQQTRCKNSIRRLGEKKTVMHHNRSVDWRDEWSEMIERLGIIGDQLSQAIGDARRILFDFTGGADDSVDYERGPIVPVPVQLEEFYEHVGFPDPRTPADHARSRARNSDNGAETADRVSAWHLHAGATYWLSWHWTGSESSQAFRNHRRNANDLLFNPEQMVERVRTELVTNERARIVREVVGEGATMEDATPEQREEINARLNDNEAVVEINNSVESLEDALEEFRDTEERLDRVADAMG